MRCNRPASAYGYAPPCWIEFFEDSEGKGIHPGTILRGVGVHAAICERSRTRETQSNRRHAIPSGLHAWRQAGRSRRRGRTSRLAIAASSPLPRAGHSPASAPPVAVARTYGKRDRRRSGATGSAALRPSKGSRRAVGPALRRDGQAAFKRCIPSANVQRARFRVTFWSMPLIGRDWLRRMRPSALRLRPCRPPRMTFS